jgi:hypothetical protein
MNTTMIDETTSSKMIQTNEDNCSDSCGCESCDQPQDNVWLRTLVADAAWMGERAETDEAREFWWERGELAERELLAAIAQEKPEPRRRYIGDITLEGYSTMEMSWYWDESNYLRIEIVGGGHFDFDAESTLEHCLEIMARNIKMEQGVDLDELYRGDMPGGKNTLEITRFEANGLNHLAPGETEKVTWRDFVHPHNGFTRYDIDFRYV